MPANASLVDRKWLMRRYLIDRWVVAAIAAEAGCDPSTVHRALQRHGIPLRGPAGRQRWDGILTPSVLRAAAEKGQTHVDVAHRFGAPPRLVHDHMLRLGLLAAPGDAELARRYEAGEPLTVLALVTGQSVRTVARRLRGSGVTLRPVGRPKGGD